MATALFRNAIIGIARFLVGGHPRWVGTEPTLRQRIYFANHSSHLDTILLWAALPPLLRRTTHPVAAADYWGATPTRRMIALDVLGCVLIDRSRANPAADPLAPANAVLEQGESLVIFPEGTRGHADEPAPFKAGLYNLALAHPAAELVPVWLDNLSRAFPKGAWLPAPIACTVRFGTPIRVEGSEAKDAFLARAREAVMALASPAA
ncbi:1-acyl-sn-glycerol-3-phosphate acyltransferase [Aureimonas leprariae]|uniref:1-acyl-sn-glycerol-3-phosphate acyltransferase n=1 Tax=Plantimonas leprariae TaxID=2615207 RepID=A0A7V7PN09_9HYPH|nr:1-acyl-sn-glycerol-3-phosphate acyltransferase [Aureimonas leprariae]